MEISLEDLLKEAQELSIKISALKNLRECTNVMENANNILAFDKANDTTSENIEHRIALLKVKVELYSLTHKKKFWIF